GSRHADCHVILSSAGDGDRRRSPVVRLSLLVLSEREDFATRVSRQLNTSPHAHVSAVVTWRERLAEAVQERRPDLIFADLAPAPDPILEAIAALPQPRPPLLLPGPPEDAARNLRPPQAPA